MAKRAPIRPSATWAKTTGALYAGGATLFENASSTGNTVVGNSNMANLAPGDTIGIIGNSSTVNAGSATIFVNTNDSSDTINGGSNTMNAAAGSSFSVTGNGNTINITGAGDAVTATGSSNTFVYNAGFGTQSISEFTASN